MLDIPIQDANISSDIIKKRLKKVLECIWAYIFKLRVKIIVYLKMRALLLYFSAL